MVGWCVDEKARKKGIMLSAYFLSASLLNIPSPILEPSWGFQYRLTCQEPSRPSLPNCHCWYSQPGHLQDSWPLRCRGRIQRLYPYKKSPLIYLCLSLCVIYITYMYEHIHSFHMFYSFREPWLIHYYINFPSLWPKITLAWTFIK